MALSRNHIQGVTSLVSQWTGNEYKQMEKIYLGILAGAVDIDVIRTVRALIDFIHYARLQYHTEKTVKKMDQAWSAFHANKRIFKKLDIREHFNIPKLHSMHHYIMSVKSHGSLDGYNSESPERLHIDFAKAGYNASSKKDYIAQMTTWLSRREAVHRFTAYLAWIEEDASRPEVTEDSGDEDDDGSEHDDEPIENGVQTYHVAKAPGYGNLSVADLSAQFGATDFLSQLDQFLRRQGIYPHNFYTISVPFAVYKQVVLYLPKLREVSDLTDLRDRIRTRRSEPAQGRKKAVAAQFDTALAYKDPVVKKAGKLDGEYPMRQWRLPQLTNFQV
jgi:hypothetical protein